MPFLLQQRFLTQGHFALTQVHSLPHVHSVIASQSCFSVPNKHVQCWHVSEAHSPQRAYTCVETNMLATSKVEPRMHFMVAPFKRVKNMTPKVLYTRKLYFFNKNHILIMHIYYYFISKMCETLKRKLAIFFKVYLTSLKKPAIFLHCTESIYWLVVSDGRKDGDIHVF